MRTSVDQSRLVRATAATALLAGFVLTALIAILVKGLPSITGVLSPSMLKIVWFTILQSALSTLVSIALAVPLAFFLDQLRDFPLRPWIIGLFALPLSMPVIVGVMAILSLLGRNGWLAELATMLGFNFKPNIYGLDGILLAHVFFNLPLAARLLLSALDATPDAHWKLAESLKFGTMDKFRTVSWPALGAALPGTAGLIFLLCLTSFAVVVILGGGPAATTLEVAIYHSLTFDLDLGRAAVLTIFQVVIVSLVLAAIRGLSTAPAAAIAVIAQGRRFTRNSAGARVIGSTLIVMSALFVAAPFLAILLGGISADHREILGSPVFREALSTSLAVSFCAAFLATLLASALVAGTLRPRLKVSRLAPVFAVTPNLILAFSPIMLGTGWFIVASKFGNPFQFAVPLVIAVNALMALPFAYRQIEPAFAAAALRHDRLSESLRISGWTRLRVIDLPTLRRPLLSAFSFAMALSFGDLGVVTLFGSDGLLTLPALLFAKMGSYRGGDANAIALYLTVLSIGLVILANTLRGERDVT